MEPGISRLKNKKLISNIAILEKMEAMEKKMNDLIEENKQLRKLNQKLKTTSQRITKKIKQPEMLFGSIDEEFCEDKLAQLRQDGDIEGIKS